MLEGIRDVVSHPLATLTETLQSDVDVVHSHGTLEDLRLGSSEEKEPSSTSAATTVTNSARCSIDYD
jgi:hypothetical protein